MLVKIFKFTQRILISTFKVNIQKILIIYKAKWSPDLKDEFQGISDLWNARKKLEKRD